MHMFFYRATLYSQCIQASTEKTAFPVSSEIYLHIIINELSIRPGIKTPLSSYFPLFLFISLYFAMYIISARRIAAQY